MDEANIRLVHLLNQARQQLGQFVDTENEFGVNAELNEFTRIRNKYPSMTLPDIAKAIEMAWKEIKMKRAVAKDPYAVRLETDEVERQINVMIQQSREAEAIAMKRLEAPVKQGMTADEFIANVLPKAWANAKKYGYWVLPPIWSTKVFPDQAESKIIAARLAADKAFDDKAKNWCKDEANRLFIQDMTRNMKAQNVQDGRMFHEPNGNYDDEQTMARLIERIDKYNRGRFTFKYDPQSSWIQSKKTAMILQFCKLNYK